MVATILMEMLFPCRGRQGGLSGSTRAIYFFSVCLMRNLMKGVIAGVICIDRDSVCQNMLEKCVLCLGWDAWPCVEALEELPMGFPSVCNTQFLSSPLRHHWVVSLLLGQVPEWDPWHHYIGKMKATEQRPRSIFGVQWPLCSESYNCRWPWHCECLLLCWAAEW